MTALLVYMLGAIITAEYTIKTGESYRAGALYGLGWPLLAAIFLILAPLIDDAD